MRDAMGWTPRLAVTVVGIAGLVIGAVGLGSAQPAGRASDETAQILMVTFRGCEEACEGFQDYVAASELDADVTVWDLARDPERLPGYVQAARDLAPDLLVTWGTTVTLGMVGTVNGSGENVVAGIPTVFMIVADPVGAGIVSSYEDTGRPMVTGTRNRVPESVQLRALADYRQFDRIGLVYNDDEVNALLKADEIRQVARDLGFEIVERIIEADDDGAPLVDDIPRAVADVAAAGVDFLYVGSSSFLLDNRASFTNAALANDLPVATAYEAMVREAGGLIALASPYYNVGQLAGHQAERILLDGVEPGDLEVAQLDRFSVIVNMQAARELDLYPPMLLLRYAEIVNAPSNGYEGG